MSRFNWKRTPARGEISSGIQQWALVDTDRDEVLLRLEDGAKPSLTEYGELIICLLLNDWAERQKETAPEPASGPGPDRELTLLDGTVYRKVGSNGMNAYDELDRMQRELTRTRDLLTEAIRKRDEARDRLGWDRLEVDSV
jgi:hypothetical protein